VGHLISKKGGIDGISMAREFESEFEGQSTRIKSIEK